MKINLVLMIFCLLFLNLAANAQEQNSQAKEEKTKPVNQTAKKYTAQDYENLVAKLKSGDTKIDFTALRMSFAQTKDYSFHGPEKSEQEKFFKPLSDKKYKESLKQAEKYLEKNYVDANAHYVVYTSAAELKDDDNAAFHKAILLGLLSSIKDGNDGLSEKSPFSVITIDEEYTMMRFLGYKYTSQSLQHINGHTFDVFTVTDPKSGKEFKLYFNIDVVWAAETKLFGG